MRGKLDSGWWGGCGRRLGNACCRSSAEGGAYWKRRRTSAALGPHSASTARRSRKRSAAAAPVARNSLRGRCEPLVHATSNTYGVGLQELLAVPLGSTRPEHIRGIHEHFMGKTSRALQTSQLGEERRSGKKTVGTLKILWAIPRTRRKPPRFNRIVVRLSSASNATRPFKAKRAADEAPRGPMLALKNWKGWQHESSGRTHTPVRLRVR